MKRMSDESNSSSFYYMAGLCVGRIYGDAPMEFRKKVVNKFKEWVDTRAGSNPLPTDQTAVNNIVKQFLYEFKRGESRVKRH